MMFLHSLRFYAELLCHGCHSVFDWHKSVSFKQATVDSQFIKHFLIDTLL